MADLEARMQHEEERLSCAVERLAGPQRVREEGPEYLMKKSHKRRQQLQMKDITTPRIDLRENVLCVLPHQARP